MNLRPETVEFNPCIVALAGPPFSGKSTLARELVRRTNMRSFDNNDTRWLYGPAGEEFDRTLVRSAAMYETYGLTHFKAIEHLDRGTPVVVAGTYSHGDYVHMLRGIADLHRRLTEVDEPALRIFALEVSEESLKVRVKQRIAAGISFPVIHLDYVRHLREVYVPIKGTDVTHINTGLSIDENIGQIIAALEPFRKAS